MLIQPGLISSISGKLGDEVYSRTQDGITVRMKGTVDQPFTIRQTILGTLMKDAVNNWQNNLSEEQRLEWNLYARQVMVHKRMSGMRPMNGYHCYIQRFMNLSLISAAVPSGPYDNEPFFGESYQVQRLYSFSISPEGSGTKFFLYGAANGFGGPTDAMIMATPCVPPGTRYLKNLWRWIGGTDPLDGFNGGDYMIPYTNIFPAGLTVGKQVSVRIIPIALAHGNRGIFSEATAIVT